MELENLTVRRRVAHNLRAKNYASETQVYNTDDIAYAIPSISKKDGITDGLVNAEVKIKDGKTGGIKIWVTELASAVAALDATNIQGVTVKRKKEGLRGKNFASETQYYNLTNVKYAIPSISKKDGVTDGQVNSEIQIDDGDNGITLWCTDLVATIEAYLD